MTDNRQCFFSPQAVNDIFLDLTRLSCCSGAENPVRQYIGDFVNKLIAAGQPVKFIHYDEPATEPGERVIVVSKAAAKGKEQAPKVVLQAHMDMVCQPDCDIFPLKLYEDQDNPGWLRAYDKTGTKNTTLGADDGIGLAIALAIMADENLQLGPLEFLFTVEEETSMAGAAKFNKEWLTGRIYLNLDSEDQKAIAYSSAGGIISTFTLRPALMKKPETHQCLDVHIFGLKGGHSGANINDGRANAIILLARALAHLNKRLPVDLEIRKAFPTATYEFNLISFTSNSVDNAIPSDVKATIAIKKDQVANFTSDFLTYGRYISKEYRGVETPQYECSEAHDNGGQCMFDEASTDRCINVLLALPHGTYQTNAQKDLVEISTNLAMVKSQAEGTGTLQITCSNRSSTDSGLEYICQIQRAIAAGFGLALEQSNWYPVWYPDENSRLLQIARGVYEKKYGADYHCQIVHAGLECSWVVEHYKHDPNPIDCISLGPTVKEPHTTEERLKLDSVAPFWECLLEILTTIRDQCEEGDSEF